ncbi:MAG: hypothetical protein ACREBF_05115 [Candidatus Micrarchaeales archaeon]
MNYHAYIRRRCADLISLRFKLHKLFNFLHAPDFERLQELFNEAEQILRKYEQL